jgi:hypothetical protein
MVLWLALFAEIRLVLPVRAVGQSQALVVLPGHAVVAHDHLAPSNLALVTADAAIDGIFLLFILRLIAGMR